ncbi:hypothetical protein BC939DRAFT_495215 [Gamsiella multidivaricata]|uniref:uncharacterized protein n=1 Tax=Gamsiella multidivaricata TaxID=101098 RepID=UPI00221E7F3B|nr:uncharacterized protein BC939DRAFT_495215 [Gamsiella multidivaricata]KAI7819546.1 hypothetical protein BC939DRAFT_495215 [Gamsiella multidivaricata]
MNPPLFFELLMPLLLRFLSLLVNPPGNTRVPSENLLMSTYGCNRPLLVAVVAGRVKLEPDVCRILAGYSTSFKPEHRQSGVARHVFFLQFSSMLVTDRFITHREARVRAHRVAKNTRIQIFPHKLNANHLQRMGASSKVASHRDTVMIGAGHLGVSSAIVLNWLLGILIFPGRTCTSPPSGGCSDCGTWRGGGCTGWSDPPWTRHDSAASILVPGFPLADRVDDPGCCCDDCISPSLALDP